METKSKITERRVKSEKFSRHRGTRMQKIDIPEGHSILRSHLEGVYNIPEHLVRFCKTFFPKADWTDWLFKQGIMDPEGYNRSLKPSSPKLFLMGMCDIKQKFIMIDPYFCDRKCPDLLRVTILLHEMAHAVTTETHTKKFFNRLERCKRFAQKLGHDPLVKILDKEIKEVKKNWQYKDGTMRKDPQGFEFQDEE
jgi:hypothetical protein